MFDIKIELLKSIFGLEIRSMVTALLRQLVNFMFRMQEALDFLGNLSFLVLCCSNIIDSPDVSLVYLFW